MRCYFCNKTMFKENRLSIYYSQKFRYECRNDECCFKGIIANPSRHIVEITDKKLTYSRFLFLEKDKCIGVFSNFDGNFVVIFDEFSTSEKIIFDIPIKSGDDAIRIFEKFKKLVYFL